MFKIFASYSVLLATFKGLGFNVAFTLPLQHFQLDSRILKNWL